jgi:hypothetical protein
MDTGKSLRKTGISPSGEIPSCPHNALLEILSRNHARVVPDGFLRDLPVSMPTRSGFFMLRKKDLHFGPCPNWNLLFVFWMHAKKEKATCFIRVPPRKSASNNLSL